MKFTLEDYKKSLKGVGLKTKKNIIDRAISEKRFTFHEIKELVDLAYPDPF